MDAVLVSDGQINPPKTHAPTPHPHKPSPKPKTPGFQELQHTYAQSTLKPVKHHPQNQTQDPKTPRPGLLHCLEPAVQGAVIEGLADVLATALLWGLARHP